MNTTTTILMAVLGGVGAHVYSRLVLKEKLNGKDEVFAFAKATFGAFLCIITAGGGIVEIRNNQEVCVEAKKS